MKEYEQYVKQIENVLRNTEIAILATQDNDLIHARAMCLVNDGLKVYMQTDKTFNKVAEIQKNENVALNVGAYNFIGKAKIVGEPKGNPWFLEEFKKKHLKSYEKYTNLPNEVLIEIDLTECRIWSKTMVVISFLDKTVKQIAYDVM